jgi:serine/threonine protein kinase
VSTAEKKPPAFYCPECGQKHRADLSGLEGKAGAMAKMNCAGCGILLGVILDEDDLPVPQALETSVGEAPLDDEGDEGAEVVPVAAAPVSSRKRRGQRKGKAADDVASAADARDRADEAEFEKGDQVGRYAIEEFIGVGGTSTVYAAFDATTNRTVALKVLKSDQSETMRERFMREIEVQANIRHQNIMPVFDSGSVDDGRPFFTMELLYKPWSLTELVEHREKGTLSRYTTLRSLADLDELISKVIVPVADGIYVANVENGVIHRDLKPDNVLIDSRTLRPYVIDFGICHVMEKKSLDTGPVVAPTGEAAGIVGTPRFLAPEQAKGNVNSRTDVWGLGALMHFVLSGEPPLEGAAQISRSELKERIKGLEKAKAAAEKAGKKQRVVLCQEKLARLQDPKLRTLESIFKDAKEGNYSDLPSTVPSAITAVVRKAMAKTQSDRYVNARQLSADLQAWLKGGGVRALRQEGGKAAAVESARRMMRTHLRTAVLVVLGAVAGLLIGNLLAGKRAVGSSTRVDDARAELDGIEKSLRGLERLAPEFTPVERSRIWSAYQERLEAVAARLSDEPKTELLAAVERRLRFVRGIIAPPRINVAVPAGTPVAAVDLQTEERRQLQAGENPLPPGAYRLDIGASAQVRTPVDVPLRIRDVNHQVDTEPALAIIELPLALEAIPAGQVLVLSAPVRARDLPFAEPARSTLVPAFFMQQREVTNSEYARFLETLPEDERAARTPATGFAPAEDGKPPAAMAGKQSLPVVGVRPIDAVAYAAWRAEQDGVAWHVAREDEWVLAAGAGMGFQLPGGAKGFVNEGDFIAPLKPAGANPRDESPYGVRGMLSNAREIVVSITDPNDFFVKGAGVGDDPDQALIYRMEPIGKKDRDAVTGFRLTRPATSPGG